MHIPFARWLAVFTWLSSSNCGDSDHPPPGPDTEDAAVWFAQAMCGAEINCRCGLHASVDECEAETEATFDMIMDMGVAIDKECFEEYISSEVFSECSEAPQTPPCVAMMGSGDVGDPCVAWNMFTMLPGQTCRPGLRCSVTGVCEDPLYTKSRSPESFPIDGGEFRTPVIELGQPCSPKEVRPCGNDAWCDAVFKVCVDLTPFICVNQPVPQ